MATTKLTAADWIVTGHEVVAWISDTELFDVTFDHANQRFALRLNNVATAAVVFIGSFDSLADAMSTAASLDTTVELAQQVAAAFNIDPTDDSTLEFRCEHGRTLVEPCDNCADEFGNAAGGK